MLVVILFAGLYGIVADSSSTTITHDGHQVHSLGDALLLSLNVAFTGGIPDLSLTGAVRIAVYAEMLLFIGAVGTNVVVAGAWPVNKLEDAISRSSDRPEREQ